MDVCQFQLQLPNMACWHIMFHRDDDTTSVSSSNEMKPDEYYENGLSLLSY